MPEATFLKGNPEFVDYTPGGAIAAGEVVVVGATPLVAHRAIAASEKGALASFGGVYFGVADGAIGAGVAVYWNNTTNKFTVSTNTGANTHFGFAVPGSTAAADGDTLYVEHRPCRAAI